MARVLAISADLLLGSKVEAMLRAAGHEVSLAPSLDDASLDGVELVVADLEAADAATLAALPAPALAYYSHVDAEAKRAAEAAGVALVVPRSRMARELPALAAGLLGDD